MPHLTSTPDQSLLPVRGRSWRSSALLTRLLATSDSPTPLILRLSLGGVVLAHGLQKVFGWFDGYGIEGTLGFFTSIGVPRAIGALVIISDFIGSLALIAGLATRFAAAAAGAVMLGAIALVHASNGFFMNWAGATRGEGYEFHVLAVAMAAALMLSGGGRWSLDGWAQRRM